MFLGLIFTFFTGCSAKKKPIQYGKDACDHCKMIIMDPKFGAEIITSKGKIYLFDDIICMTTFINDSHFQQQDVAEVYVVDYQNQRELIDGRTAFYVKSDLVKSPMAGGIAAFSTQEQRYNQQQKWQGQELTWEDVNSMNK
jgi:copper chaperone NosL